MSRILIGTASWTDKSLIASGRFYPPKCNSPEDRLRYYASQFPLVEVDSSYYAMPAPQVAQLWAERTPPDFTFNIKAFRLFTGHQTAPAALPKDIAEALGRCEGKHLYYKDLPAEITDEMWRRFREGIEPLQALRASWLPSTFSSRRGSRSIPEASSTSRTASEQLPGTSSASSSATRRGSRASTRQRHSSSSASASSST